MYKNYNLFVITPPQQNCSLLRFVGIKIETAYRKKEENRLPEQSMKCILPNKQNYTLAVHETVQEAPNQLEILQVAS